VALTSRGGLWGSVTDVPGVGLGHATRVGDGALTGVTVVLPPPGTVGSVDVRGGGPGTHETDALDPSTLVPTVDAVVLTGGSAFGLAAATGAQAWLEEQGRGFAVRMPDGATPLVVPIVPAACVFDLGRGGDPAARPDAPLGRAAAEAAAVARPVAAQPVRGAVGAGTGALAGFQALKGGTGTAAVTGPAHGLPEGVVVGAVAVVNALGSPVDPVTGALLGAAFVPAGMPRPQPPSLDEAARLASLLAPGDPDDAPAPGTATTLAVVVTNARLDVAQCRRTATSGHDGIARAVRPAHTLFDGDTVFALATGTVEVGLREVAAVQAAAADAVLLACLDAVLAATAVRTPTVDVPGYLDICPSAAPLT
jgi:L-aminopeptidase/D-esterase-like protein